MKIKKGDTVKVISGKEKGKQGKVVKVLRESGRVVVEGVNKVKRHKKSQGEGQPGGIVEFEAPMYSSKVMVVDAKTNKPTRIGFKFENDKKVRVAKKTDTVIK